MTSSKAEKIKTLNVTPGSGGVNIDRDKYDAMKKALLKVVPRTADGVPFKGLRDRVAARLPDEVYGPETSVGWYLTVVKLDLEARGLLERVPGAKPQHLRRPRGGGR